MPVRLLILGDFIDRGLQSAEVAAFLRRQQLRTKRLTILKGNHEAALLDCLDGDAAAQRAWIEYGGRQSLQSFGIAPPEAGESAESFAARLRAGLGAELLEWLEALPLFATSGDYFFCHAGVRPHIPLHRQDPDDLLTIRHDFLESKRNHGAVIVHGHSGGERVQYRKNRICIDTTVYESGRLSALGLEGNRKWTITSRIRPRPDPLPLVQANVPNRHSHQNASRS